MSQPGRIWTKVSQIQRTTRPPTLFRLPSLPSVSYFLLQLFGLGSGLVTRSWLSVGSASTVAGSCPALTTGIAPRERLLAAKPGSSPIRGGILYKLNWNTGITHPIMLLKTVFILNCRKKSV